MAVGNVTTVKNNPWVTYRNGNYVVALNTLTGTKKRLTWDDDEYVPEYPESMDVKITDYCDVGCPWCHENSSVHGKMAVCCQAFIDTLPPYREIAVGGGNVLSYPWLEDFLGMLIHQKCFPSITVNQRHFLENFDYVKSLYERGLVYGVGVSLTGVSPELISALKQIPTAVLHVIAGLFGEKQVEALSGNDLTILILGYKTIRRGRNYIEENSAKILENIWWVKNNLDVLSESFNAVAFDNLSVKQLDVKSWAEGTNWDYRYMGDDGQFTFYIDMVSKTYAVSSTESETVNFPIGGLSVQEMFQNVRKVSSKCGTR